MPHTSPSLLTIGSDALSAILCYLPFADKLLHLTHITRAFPALVPLHFAFDEVKLGEKTIKALYSSPKVLPLLALSRAVLISTAALQDSTAGGLSLFHPLPGGLLVFPSLRKLTFRLSTSGSVDHSSGLMDKVFKHLAPFVQLHTLDFHRKDWGVAPFALSPLRDLSALRHVKLRGFDLAMEMLSMLCSLQVETLDLEGSTLEPLEEEDVEQHIKRLKFEDVTQHLKCCSLHHSPLTH